MIADFPPPQDFFDKLNECIHKTNTRLAVLRLLACMLNLQVQQTDGARDLINKTSWETAFSSAICQKVTGVQKVKN